MTVDLEAPWCADGNYCRAPSKKGVCTAFAVIFQVAGNPLKFGMQTLFVIKNACFFFQEGRKICILLRENPSLPLLCLYPNNVGFRSLRDKTLRVCFTLLEGKGGISRKCFKPRFPSCGTAGFLVWPILLYWWYFWFPYHCWRSSMIYY